MAGTMDSAEARAEDARITVVQVAAGEAHTLALTGAFKVNPRGCMPFGGLLQSQRGRCDSMEV